MAKSKVVAKPGKKGGREFDDFTQEYSDLIGGAVAFAGQEHDFYLKLKADLLLADIEKHYPGKGKVKVIDVGCGHGLMHPHIIKSKRVALTGVDPAATVIAEAKKLHPKVTYKDYDGVTLPYAANSFDIATAVCVMHHVAPAQWQHFLREMKRVVNPGGHVFIYEHNPYNPATAYIVKTCPIDADAVLLPARKLRGLMRSAGLKRVGGSFIIFFPFAQHIFRAIERALTWLPLGAQHVAHGRK